ncbi:phytanoyl-CoA dioxygenase [Coniochaeta sp. 2T2.1]|nr:phytanoyl-CoA dioxygenase [Coniochaeta sp. 2T2.1]
MPADPTVYTKEALQKYYQPKHKPLPTDPTLRRHVETVLRDGYCIIPGCFSEFDALEAKSEIDRLHGPAPKTGRDTFDGLKTNRVFSLIAKSRVFDKFCLIPAVRALNEFFLDDEYLLYIMESIVIQPGEKAQILHHDDAPTRLPRPRPAVTAATMICLDDYTEFNGATRIIPGSHLWGQERMGEDEEAKTAVCPRGSVVYFLGTTWHSGGANRSDKPRYALTVQYCQPYIRPLDNLMLSVDPRRVLNGEIPREIANMMGYRSAFPFIGYSDGINPRKATARMLRRLQAPIDYFPPGFASEEGEKEKPRELNKYMDMSKVKL